MERQQGYARTVEQLRRTHQELNHLVRALSHDMSANFMLLESSFSQLKAATEGPGGRTDGPGSDQLGELAAHVEACLGESKRLLNDLVDLGRTGTVEMEPSRVDLEAVVDEVLFEQRELLSGRGVRVDVERPLGHVWCNRHRLKQVVTNLVRNATIHGGDQAAPRVTISTAVSAPEGREMFAIRVHDNGPGIDPELAEEAFLPGRRLPKAAAEGSGLGLAIVRKIVEHYGGTARFDRQCKAGTAVVVTLPARGAERPPAKPHWEGSPSETMARSTGRQGTHSAMPAPAYQSRARQRGLGGRP